MALAYDVPVSEINTAEPHPARIYVHEVAQEIAPSARVVYVDNDPLVLAHARALRLVPLGLRLVPLGLRLVPLGLRLVPLGLRLHPVPGGHRCT